MVRFSWVWTMTPSLINNFYAGGNDWRQDHKPPQEYIGNWQSKFCLTNVPNCNENLVNLFSGGTGDTYSTWGGQADNGSENTIYAYNDDVTWLKGKHTLKFGGMFQITHYNGFGRQCEAGCVGFSYQETGVPGGPTRMPAATPSPRSCWAMRIAARSIRSGSLASSSTMWAGIFKTTGALPASWL